MKTVLLFLGHSASSLWQHHRGLLAATIVARRYGKHKWVPYVSYGMAALIGFSRLTLSAHFVSDVFVGGTLGYSVSRFTVLQQ